VERIELSNYGEIFLNPQLLLILEYAHLRKVSLTANNGVNLNSVKPEMLEAVVKYGLSAMSCSIDGASQETYERYRIRGTFATVIANIRKINEFKTAYRSPLPLLRWQFVVFGHNEHELPLARAMARELAMEFYAKLTWDSDFSPITDTESAKAWAGTDAATREEYEERHGKDYMHGICHQLWDHPTVNWDGKVLGCCRNFWGDFGGNAFADGLVESINNEKIDYAREMLLGAKSARDDIPCTKCDIYLKMRRRDRWLQRKPTHAGTRMTIDEALERARKLYDIGRLSDAARIYDSVLTAKPEHCEALYALGLAAYEVGNRDAAANFLRRAIVLRPGDKEISQLLHKALAADRCP
jgi:MoaA/NifB/PqqE/SkfB family radical SAM enzyme